MLPEPSAALPDTIRIGKFERGESLLRGRAVKVGLFFKGKRKGKLFRYFAFFPSDGAMEKDGILSFESELLLVEKFKVSF